MRQATTGNEGSGAHPLDNAVWHALAGEQQRFALGDERARRFPPELAPFAGLAERSPAAFDALRALIDTHGPAALVTPDEIPTPGGCSVVRRAVLHQMIWQGTPDDAQPLEHVRLTEGDVPAMLELIAATEPGPFGPRTIEFGGYLGVRSEGRLVAMAGQRLTAGGHTEISAVCVDPAFRGQGLAAGLIRALIARIRARAETPFLHVLSSNRVAIERYLALGFTIRRDMQLLVLGREETGTGQPERQP
ncbi:MULTISPECIES: GNAT family N-acetyltransferase [unclassified Burkholderia]|uniref:GNAT family N-acetyltransferase n=1 Tax=unclassified Burkholderia TaxID=2613784 RepID=UPI000F57844C|nr:MULTISPECIES: GNAT family N-acetyltransferase [unclassified Burkholderia]RQR87502.1 GNAT family N-acetyltransferase [Burkholderia sp. Bp9011]RQR96852.1 GNAT family N-acetyltransferase [Burkholderia sp. Bp9010]RQS07473.1 GNAT family N-acetyltransferase [Burkholderia sp. Bp8991]RQS30756.1 GNAT family N-acetyltransferase [Burkholderia sp. Bp8995]RQS51549.1 GNAT family N-acetyltransferase [Burkholderia sp. Bp8989]